MCSLFDFFISNCKRFCCFSFFSKVIVFLFQNKFNKFKLFVIVVILKLFVRICGLSGRKIYDILAEYFLPLQHGIRTL